MEGRPVQVIQVDPRTHKFQVNEKAVQELLLKPDVRDLPLAVISVAGAFRTGKSFLLGYIIRYMEKQGAKGWMGDPEEPLKGFSWKGGPTADTNGILMWSKIYRVKSKTHGEIGVLLLDTQGTFDSKSTVKDCTTVFALSTLISSVQIYNIMRNIQEDNLQTLHLFTEYGRIVRQEEHNTKAFQKLTFLVRDWQWPETHSYGLDGGQTLLDEFLKVTDNQHHQLQSVLSHINSCFDSIQCFLMPNPNTKPGSQFDGRYSQLSPDFVQYIETLFKELLAPHKLLPKEIGGKHVTAQELYTFTKRYMEIFSKDEMPEPKSLMEVTTEMHNKAAMENSLEEYVKCMNEECKGKMLEKDNFEEVHKFSKDSALAIFNTSKKFGDEAVSVEYFSMLELKIEELYRQYENSNEAQREMQKKEEEARKYQTDMEEMKRNIEEEKAKGHKQESERMQKEMETEIKRLKKEQKKYTKDMEKKLEDLEREKMELRGEIALEMKDQVIEQLKKQLADQQRRLQESSNSMCSIS